MVNYKVELSVLHKRLPAPFRPRSTDGYGMAGFCLFRLSIPKRRRIALMVVHRIEVEAVFEANSIPGTYVLRCDTASSWFGPSFGDFFPNVMHAARLNWIESADSSTHSFRMGRRDQPWLTLRAHETPRFPQDSVLRTEEAASAFFSAGQVWFAPRYAQTLFEQRAWNFNPWQVAPLLVDELDAPFFRSIMRFPNGSFYFDHALVMKNLTYQAAAPVELIAPRPIKTLWNFHE